jgi:ArsR family transcriptional regulator, arsenate/arsenite/antimonite-responsive transcriptional repressor
VNRYVDQFNALGQAGRLEIFRLLVRAGPEGDCVEEIRRRVKMPGSTLSHHLDTLTRCGLLSARRDGRFIYYAVNWPEAARLIRFLTEDCCAEMHTRLCGGSNATGEAPDRSARRFDKRPRRKTSHASATVNRQERQHGRQLID